MINMKTRIEIQKKKQPVALIVIFSLFLGALAIWLLLHFVYPTLPGFRDLKLSAVGAIAGAISFGIYAVIKQASKIVPGLIIDDGGITDYSNIASIGFIPWSDIDSIKEVKGDFNRNLIVIVVKNPEIYINKSSRMSTGRKYQFQPFGSPILINPASLEIYPQKLNSILVERLNIDYSD